MVDTFNARKIDGWMSDEELLWLATEATKHNTICEIGCWLGRSTRALLDNTQGTVYAVDTWKGTAGDAIHAKILSGKHKDWLLKSFITNMGPDPRRLVIYQSDSLSAAKYFKVEGMKFDMIFLDATHTYEVVKADIEAWMPNMDDGGLLCGHDYHDDWPGVIQAIAEMLPKAKVAGDRIWAVVL